MDKKLATIHALGAGPNLTPREFLYRVAEMEGIVNIACVVTLDRGVTDVFCTQMTIADAAWLDYVFRRDFMSGMEPKEGA